VINRNKYVLSSLRFLMKRRLTIRHYYGGARKHARTGDRGADGGGPIIETWDDMAARRVDLSRATGVEKRADPGRHPHRRKAARPDVASS
jgi:hypothetical protein